MPTGSTTTVTAASTAPTTTWPASPRASRGVNRDVGPWNLADLCRPEVCLAVTGVVTVPAEGAVDLSDLRCVTSVDGALYIMGGLQFGGYTAGLDLTSLSGLESLTRTSGLMVISGHPALTTLAGLDHLEEVDTLSIGGNPALADLSGLGSLQRAESLWLRGGNGFTDLSGLEPLTELSGDLEVASSTLQALSGLENLTTVGGTVSIQNSDQLTTLSGLDGLREVGVSSESGTAYTTTAWEMPR